MSACYRRVAPGDAQRFAPKKMAFPPARSGAGCREGGSPCCLASRRRCAQEACCCCMIGMTTMHTLTTHTLDVEHALCERIQTHTLKHLHDIARCVCM